MDGRVWIGYNVWDWFLLSTIRSLMAKRLEASGSQLYFVNTVQIGQKFFRTGGVYDVQLYIDD